MDDKFKRRQRRLIAEFVERPAQERVFKIEKHIEELRHEKVTIQSGIDNGELVNMFHSNSKCTVISILICFNQLAARDRLENRVIEIDEEFESASKQLSEARMQAEEDKAVFEKELKCEILSEADIICTTLDKCYNDPYMRAAFIEYV